MARCRFCARTYSKNRTRVRGKELIDFTCRDCKFIMELIPSGSVLWGNYRNEA